MHPRDLCNEKWERLKPLLPAQKPRTGRPAKDHRRIVNGILWVHRTGAPWRDLPERYGPWQTVSSRFYRWRKAGVWQRMLKTLQREGDAEGELDWRKHYVDGSIVRAHQHAAGAKKGSWSLRRWGAVGVGSARKSTCAPKAAVNRSSSLSPLGSGMRPSFSSI